jgi:DNA (cytosine-5)-methyltransferase 1
MTAEPITFGSLFAGIGGFDLGFERAGMSCRWQVEIDDYANRVLEKHWPDVHRERDIRSSGWHNLQPVDIIIGGFPCQDISYAGRGDGLDGERSGLFFEAVRVVRELRPRIVVLENVAALLTRGLDRVLGTLAEIGYDAEWHCIPAASVGAPHIRDRVFVIAYAESVGRETRGRIEGDKRRTRERWSQLGGSNQDMADTNWQGPQRMRGKRANEEREDTNRHPRSICVEPGDGSWKPEWWTTEPNVGRVANGVPARVDRLRGLGNAVVPQVAEYVARMVMEKINDC